MSCAAVLLQNARALLGSSRRVTVKSCITTIAISMTTRRRKQHTDARGYAEALKRLSQLKPNRSATALFESQQKKQGSREDLNAAAIPEMRDWLLRAGYTPEGDLCKMRHIHVAGTKGKGSVCAYATALLKQQGRRVGTYTSPHLVTPRERIAIDGEPVSREVFTKAFFELWDRFTASARGKGWSVADAESAASKPFFFRYMTIMAWHIFLDQGIRDVVLECGIGGEYDATNLLPPKAVSAAVVTQLGLDHVAMLGDTVEQIAWHKAGIFKAGRRAFTRRLEDQPGVMEVLRARASEKGACLVEVDDADVDKWAVAGEQPSGTLLSSTPASFQKQNQALAALAVWDHIKQQHQEEDGAAAMHLDTLPREEKAAASPSLGDVPPVFHDRLQSLSLPGRQEIYREDDRTLWFYDGAHTKESLQETARWFVNHLDPSDTTVLVFNQQERDATELLKCLLVEMASALDARFPDSASQHFFVRAIFTTNHTTFLDPEGKEWNLDVQLELARTMHQLVPSCWVSVESNVMDAKLAAGHVVAGCRSMGKVLVTGSMHLVGNMKVALDPETLLPETML
jgi:folylpolyglutamate synthase